jgi:serine/threonine protein kinase
MGNLYDYLILGEKRFSEEIARYFFKQLIDAIEYLHNKGIHHNDLKIFNILLDQEFNLKLTDFYQEPKVSVFKKSNV